MSCQALVDMRRVSLLLCDGLINTALQGWPHDYDSSNGICRCSDKP